MLSGSECINCMTCAAHALLQRDSRTCICVPTPPNLSCVLALTRLTMHMQAPHTEAHHGRP